MADIAPLTIGILRGSCRTNGNTRGVTSWLCHQLAASIAASGVSCKIVDIFPSSDSADAPVLGPVLDSMIPAGVKDGQYGTEADSQWSRLVSGCSAFVIVTPQYNHGYPGELKNALDHLYHEWRGKAVAVVTFGGHGGGKCGAQLRQVLGDGLRMRLVRSRLAITLPDSYIRGASRAEDTDAFLAPYTEQAETLCKELLGMVHPGSAPACCVIV